MSRTLSIFKLCLASIGSLALPAFAASQWQFITKGGGPDEQKSFSYYVETSGIRTEGAYVRAWIRTEFAQPQRTQQMSPYLSIEEAETFNCSQRKYARTTTIYFDERKQVVYEYAWPPSEIKFADIRPGSIAEKTLEIVCSRAQAGSKSGEQLVLYASDADGQYFYVPDALTFIGSTFKVAAAQELKTPFRDKDSGRTVTTVMMGFHGDCSSSSVAYDYLAFVDSKMTEVSKPTLNERNKQLFHPVKDHPAFLTMQFVCGTKGFTVTAAEKSQQSTKDGDEEGKKGGSMGTAFAVTPSGHLLTNHHVVDGCKTISAFGPDGLSLPARVVSSDARNDLAVVKIDAAGINAAQFRLSPIRAGDPIVALGFPYRGLLATEVNVSTGTVSALAGISNDTSKLQIQAPVQPGNSGGPLVDMNGAVAGVVVAKLDALYIAKATGDLPQNVNFAVKGEIAALFLKSANVPIKFAQVGTPRMDAADVASRIKPSVYLFECKAD